ncbi:glutamate-rich protein 2 [Pteropus vampyrus]|uniref:Glutamate-rich protein 2 n=1 Tax=Pteropus vampyrus TaxID=132908 RepID=A0A6P6CA64_PTEVA|nr:glutamate-rich protein 2 [Pteropus vampyrus]
MCPKVYAPSSRRSVTPRTAGLSRIRFSCGAPSLTPRACSAPAPPSHCPSAAPQAPPASALRPDPRPAPPRARPAPPASSGALPAPPRLPELAPPQPRPFRPVPRRLPGLQPRAVSSPWRRSVYSSVLRNPREPPAGLAFGDCPSDDRRERDTSSFGPEFCIPEIPRNYLGKTDAVKAPKYRQNGRLLVFDPKEKVMIEPNETVSDKCFFGRRPRLASKLYTSAVQVSLNVARTFLEKKEVSSKNIENKVSLKNIENRVSSKSIENKDTEINLQSKLWSSSFLKESTGEMGKDTVIAKQEKNNEHCLQDIDDKLSKSTDDDGEDDTNDEDDEDSDPNKNTHAPLELMAEFLRAEMSQDYHLAKKLCQMILIYEPENPEAKEFFSLIEEMLLMEKAQNLEEDDQDSEEESSGESEGESEELSEESSDECEDE